MDILIPDRWLKDFLKTKASPKTIMDKLSLCGPSVEKVEGKGKKAVYSIEVTTNRVDTACVYGIAREAAAILPRFNIDAKLKKLTQNKNLRKGQVDIKINPSPKYVNRVMAVVLYQIKNDKTPNEMKQRLEASGLRSKNPAVDITNYIMLETGHPTHVFDYDKIKKGGLTFRLSKKGEEAKSFEGKSYKLSGGDLVIVNDKDEIIDIPGIIGTKNSVVDDNTKNVLFFIDNNDPKLIRKTSMELGIRTNAASLNEKGVDPELAQEAMLRGLKLFKSICKPKEISSVFDWYPNPYTGKAIDTSLEFINQKIGTQLNKNDITKHLKVLGFDPSWNKNNLTVKVPSFRAKDVNIAEDIVEEVARMYGYFNLPGKLPLAIAQNFQEEPLLQLEKKIKEILMMLGGHEIYTLSMVSKEQTEKNALKLKNPMGRDAQYLRTNLAPSLTQAAQQNLSQLKFIMFEIANVYIPKANNLPEEQSKLGVLFQGHEYTYAKGVLETLFKKLNIKFNWETTNSKTYEPQTSLIAKSGKLILGQMGKTTQNLIYAQFDLKSISQKTRNYALYQPPPKFPPQIEDYTIKANPNQRLGEIINEIKDTDKNIAKIELLDTYKRNYTLRVYYQNQNKTLTKKEVKKARESVFKTLGSDLVE